MVKASIHSVTTSLLSVGEDKRDLLHKEPQPGKETITSTQLDHRLHCLTHRAIYEHRAKLSHTIIERTHYYPKSSANFMTGIHVLVSSLFSYLSFMWRREPLQMNELSPPSNVKIFHMNYNCTIVN